MQNPLILASSSAYRRELMSRLGVNFSATSPDIDESPTSGEDPAALVARLAAAKAAAVAQQQPGATVVGSDQVATLERRIIGKPGNRERAIAQLQAASGRSVHFLTGVTVWHPAQQLHHVDVTRVTFRALRREEIERYVDAERPFDCAGGFKAEGLGISLFERIDASDPTALIGLPLIWLSQALRQLGYRLP